MGNRLSSNATLSGVSSGSYSYNINDLLSIETYDSNGNTLITGGKAFAYDSENRLKSMNGGAATLLYDGDGNRVAKSASGVTTRYLVDDLGPTGYAQVVEELVGTTIQREYTYGLQRTESELINGTWTTSFYRYDGGGSVRQLTCLIGAVTDTYDYDAFGNKVKVIYSDQTSVLVTSILLLSEEVRRLFQWPVPLPLQVRLQDGNHTDCSLSADLIRWRGLGILSLAPLDLAITE